MIIVIVMVSGIWVLGLVLSGIHAAGATGQRMRSFLVRGKRAFGDVAFWVLLVSPNLWTKARVESGTN